jgi:hypothetical protein
MSFVLAGSGSLNGYIASVEVNNQITNNNEVDLKLVLTYENTTLITSALTKVSIPTNNKVIHPLVNNPNNNDNNTPTNTVSNPQEKILIDNIRQYLTFMEKLQKGDSKAAVCIELFDYLIKHCIDFINKYPGFKDQLVLKCYEFKVTDLHRKELIEKCDELLSKLNISLVVPEDIKKKYTSSTIKEEKINESNKDEIYNAEKELCTAIAKKYDIHYYDHIYNLYTEAYKKNRTKGNTVVEKMENYMQKFIPSSSRLSLMKRLFNTKNLIFNDSVMSVYGSWCTKTIKQNSGKNRFQKMTEFINIHNDLFKSSINTNNSQ